MPIFVKGYTRRGRNVRPYQRSSIARLRKAIDLQRKLDNRTRGSWHTTFDQTKGRRALLGAIVSNAQTSLNLKKTMTGVYHDTQYRKGLSWYKKSRKR